MEELVLDTRTGRALNASLMDYKIPSTEDVPAVMSEIERTVLAAEPFPAPRRQGGEV